MPHSSLFARAGDGHATLTYTATHMHRGWGGNPVGRSTLSVAAAPDFCADAREPVAELQQVSADQPRATTTIPAGRPLILQSFWSAADRHCLLGNLAFRAEPGARYRMTTDVDLRTGRCRLLVEQREGRRYRFIGQLQSVDQICH